MVVINFFGGLVKVGEGVLQFCPEEKFSQGFGQIRHHSIW